MKRSMVPLQLVASSVSESLQISLHLFFPEDLRSFFHSDYFGVQHGLVNDPFLKPLN